MGVFRDIFRLMKAGAAETARTDYVENLRLSADLAEQFAGVDPNAPLGTHGSASANPFANMAAYTAGIRGTGTVVSVTDSGKRLGEDAVYLVELEIALPERPSYRTDYRTIIAVAALHLWHEGAVFPVRVGPDAPHSVMIG